MIEIGLPRIAQAYENLGDEFGHRVADQHAGEHELIARIGLHLVDLGLEPHERRGAVALSSLPISVWMMLVRSDSR
jgi:hypothetical protein